MLFTNASNLIRYSFAFTLVLFCTNIDAAEVSDRVLRLETTVNAPVNEVWKLWSDSAAAETFLAPKVNIELKLGGPYEVIFNAADDRMTTKGCKLLSYAPGEMISFQWSLPGDMFPNFPKAATWVVVTMHSIDSSHTRLIIEQLGWGTGAEWDHAYTHMENGWNMVIEQTHQRFQSGPIDWPKQFQMWKERARQAHPESAP